MTEMGFGVILSSSIPRNASSVIPTESEEGGSHPQFFFLSIYFAHIIVLMVDRKRKVSSTIAILNDRDGHTESFHGPKAMLGLMIRLIYIQHIIES